MFCDIPQVNQLTALLVAHGIRDLVACPGSRNATIVHNFNELGEGFRLHPVTDERSAAFVAMGIALAVNHPAAVCVTSGSALLNCLPAVAEASFRHIPLLIISADRPTAWIGQLEGQTLPQEGALEPYCPTLNLCIPHTGEDLWLNNRRINEALLSLKDPAKGPAHINVPIAEPMFGFSTEQLPEERVVEAYIPTAERPLPDNLVKFISEARLPALLIGQTDLLDLRVEAAALEREGQMLLLPEILSGVPHRLRMKIFDAPEVRPGVEMPDVVVQVGGNFVHKNFKQRLRESSCEVVRVGREPGLVDTFRHLCATVEAPVGSVLRQLADELPHDNPSVRNQQAFYAAAAEQLRQGARQCAELSPRTCLKELSKQLENRQVGGLHLANSTTVRQAEEAFEGGEFPILCNRGVNGIEGSLSTAVGFALKRKGLQVVVTGDLSFFYDANALWNTRLPSNLRILLLNNGRGEIFDHLPGLSNSPAAFTYIAAGGQTFDAKGISTGFHVDHALVSSADELPQAMTRWLQDAPSAKILEVALPKNPAPK